MTRIAMIGNPALSARIGIGAVALGAVAALLGFAGPSLGLGRGEDFVLYRLFEISRRELVVDAALLIVAGIVIAVAAPLRAAAQGRGHDGWATAAMIAEWGLDTARWHRNGAVVAVLAPFALYVVAFYAVVMPDEVFLAPDSRTYLNFHAFRTILYPLFIRGVAVFADEMATVTIAQLVLGLAATIFFAEALQRLVRNVLITVPLGLVMIFNWLLFDHAGFILSDYPFYAAVTAQMGTAFLVLDRPTRGRLVWMAVATVVAIGIRPVGIFLFAGLPIVLLFRLADWRRVVTWHVVPAVVLCLGLATAHQAVFGYFGLSRFSGWAMLPNMLRTLEPDTPFEHPGLVTALYDTIKPHQEKLAAFTDAREKHVFLVNTTNAIMGDAGRVLQRFRRENPSIARATDVSRHRALVEWLDRLSPLNVAIGMLPPGAAPYHNWQDSMLSALAWRAYRHNPGTFAEHTWLKVSQSWRDQYRLFSSPTDLQATVTGKFTFDKGKPDLGFEAPNPDLRADSGAFLNAIPFKAVNAGIHVLGSANSFAGLSLMVAAVSLGLAFWQGLGRGVLPAPVAALAYAALCLIAYIFAVNIGHVALGRYLMITMPAAVLLVLAPLLLLPLAARWLRAPA